MTSDLQEEFRLLSKAAKQHLKDIPECENYWKVFSIWIWPSFFYPAVRWTIYTPRRIASSVQPQAHVTIWRNDLDWEKFASPVERLRYPKDLTPTIEKDIVWLTTEQIEAFENELKEISIPVFLGAPSIIGCDGTSYEFSYDESFFGTSLSWWENYPEEWRPFIDLVLKIVKNLETQKTRQTLAQSSGNV